MVPIFVEPVDTVAGAEVPEPAAVPAAGAAAAYPPLVVPPQAAASRPRAARPATSVSRRVAGPEGIDRYTVFSTLMGACGGAALVAALPSPPFSARPDIGRTPRPGGAIP